MFYVKIKFSEFWRLFLFVLDFSKFFGLISTCFKISVWNLVYTCSKWCYTSSLSFIPIGTLWPSLQPKIGQSHFSTFMALKIILRPQIWYTHLYCVWLDPYWFSLWLGNFWTSGGQNTWKGVLLELPASEKFSRLFCTCCEISVWIWHIHLVGGVTRQVRVSFQSGHFDLLYSQK